MKYRPEIVVRWRTCAPIACELEEIKSKIEAIIANIEDIYDYSSPEPRKGTISIAQLLKIEVDCDSDPDSFALHVDPTSTGYFDYHERDSKNSYGIYEILTESVARRADADFNCGRPELGENFDYVLGEVNSEYTKLGDSNFYYRYL